MCCKFLIFDGKIKLIIEELSKNIQYNENGMTMSRIDMSFCRGKENRKLAKLINKYEWVVWKVFGGGFGILLYHSRHRCHHHIAVDRLNVTKYSYYRILCNLIYTRCILSTNKLRTFSSCENINGHCKAHLKHKHSRTYARTHACI